MKTAVALFAAALSVVVLSTNASAQKGFSSPKAVAAEKLTDKNSNSPTKSKNPIKSSDIHFPETPNILVPKPRGGKEQVEIATPELVANIGAPSGPSATSFMAGGADTSFGTRSGGGFKLASDASIAVEKIINTLDYECEGQSYDCQGKGEYADMLDATPEFGAAPTAISETDEANPNDSPGPWSGYSTAEKPSKIVQPTTGLLFADFMNGSSGSSSDDAYALIGSMLSGSASPGDETEEYGDPIGSEAEAAKTFDYCVIYPERCTVSQIERPTFGPHMVTFDNIAGSADPGGDDI